MRFVSDFVHRLVPQAYFILAGLFFLSLGTDFPGHLQIRLAMGGVLWLALPFYAGQFFSGDSSKRIVFSVFTVFIIFQIVRIFLEPPSSKYVWLGVSGLYELLLWSYGLLFMVCGVFLLKKKDAVFSYSYLWIGLTLFFALNIIPNLFIRGNGLMAYPIGGNQYRVFFPALYFSNWVGQYFLADYSHVNRAGDILSFGFFPAFGLTFYHIHQWRSLPREIRFSFAGYSRILWFLFPSLLLASAIFLTFSRGTILFFLASSGLFLMAVNLKFPFKWQWGASLLLAGSVFIFTLWGGNLKKALNELQTLDKEKQVVEENIEWETATYKSKSIYTNLLGQRTAQAIYKTHSVWGVGSQNYKKFATQYMGEKEAKGIALARFSAMNFYWQMLAEEGIGAYIYFTFIFVWLAAVFWGLVRTQSRFKFFMGLSFAMPVILVYAHASINDLMQRFSMIYLVFFMMGAALAVLDKDFQHAV